MVNYTKFKENKKRLFEWAESSRPEKLITDTIEFIKDQIEHEPVSKKNESRRKEIKRLKMEKKNLVPVIYPKTIEELKEYLSKGGAVDFPFPLNTEYNQHEAWNVGELG